MTDRPLKLRRTGDGWVAVDTMTGRTLASGLDRAAAIQSAMKELEAGTDHQRTQTPSHQSQCNFDQYVRELLDQAEIAAQMACDTLDPPTDEKLSWLNSEPIKRTCVVLIGSTRDSEYTATVISYLIDSLSALQFIEKSEEDLRNLKKANTEKKSENRLMSFLLDPVIGRVSRRGGNSPKGVRVGHAVRQISRAVPKNTPARNALIKDLLALAHINTTRRNVSSILRDDVRRRSYSV